MVFKHYLFFLTLLYGVVSLGQAKEENRRRIFGEKGEVLDIEISKSYQPENFYEEYYVDSISRVPYTGEIKSTGGPRGYTMVEVKNGIQDGFLRDYTINTQGDKKITKIHYKNLEYHIRAWRYFSDKIKLNQTEARYVDDNGQDCMLSIRYFKNKIILRNRQGKEVLKKQFRTIEEFDTYFAHHKFKDLFKEVGFFIVPENSLTITSFQQKNTKSNAHYRGENGETLIKVNNPHLEIEVFSDLYIDSVTNVPYTGSMTRTFNTGRSPSDSMCVINGKINGYWKHYKTKKTVLAGVRYIDPIAKVQIYLEMKRGKKYSGKIICDNIEYCIKFNKKTVDITKYENLSGYKSRVLKKNTLANLGVLKPYLAVENHSLIDTCKEVGFFDEKIVIPIIKGNC